MENDFKGRKCAGFSTVCMSVCYSILALYLILSAIQKIVKKNMTWQKRISIKKPDVISFVIGKT